MDWIGRKNKIKGPESNEKIGAKRKTNPPHISKIKRQKKMESELLVFEYTSLFL